MTRATKGEIALHLGRCEIDVISVKRKIETTRVFELLGAVGQVSEQRLRLKELFEHARRVYLAQDWDLAETSFRECLQVESRDGPSAVFLKRIQKLRQSAPEKDWTGAWQLAEK